MITRIYHPWDKWEDYKAGFYGGKGYPRDNTLALCASLLKDLNRFEEALKIIIGTWKYSCEHNLTNEALNRIAYLGQAACALVYGVPHNVSMGAYNLLNDTEKKVADAMAKKYLDLWLYKYDFTEKAA